MFGLALHTSTPELGLAISDFETIQRHQTWDLGRDLSSQLHALLQGFLAPQSWEDLRFIVICIGPGGFTGTRIGVTTARTLAQQLDIPLFGVSALAAIAHHQLTVSSHNSEPGNGQATDIAVTMPAKRGAVYGAIYHWNGTTLLAKLDDTVLPASDWQAKQLQWPQSLLPVSVEPGIGLADTTLSLLQLGYDHWQAGQHPNWREIIPFYGQHPVKV
ncbi:tRNA (adenosine(37)-N6)-threonylcarbamoyltransferase complex dimerization subunit type 1 TsaB [Leptothoe spongobia TAU-MAC 1115]|uniref:tRNA (Adenosine(37)-N6)-threonylcarbamoyltransferase complex dimerization subunit type 1 TsaB n=2 Tax=Leptothoe TaxID=2651725 RepID=A0A947DCB0_9CYAN|nr:tRNA (adenosine(37)-N6)-threonylcarbamoyltransferase complex dimerization subunit type 1 TsaB [Leptothoe spongobia TAU-MAC 1115]